jgi:hypothetical protein
LLLQVPARPWLARLECAAGRPLGFADVPDAELDAIRARGFDGIWLMGVWTTGPRARRLALSSQPLQQAYESLLPDWEPADVGGSPYSIAAYEPLAERGGRASLARLRARLRERGLGLVLDFVPNHLGIDHAWLDDHPDRLVRGSARLLAREPGNWFVHTTSDGEDRVFAHGRDPHFAGWTDTVQVDLRRRGARRALAEILRDVASLADGLRCDVAMLPLADVFARTWGPPDPSEAGDFWTEAVSLARDAHPELVLFAEVYWGLGPRLLALGFDWVYDKDLLDALVGGDLAAVGAHVARPSAEHAGRVRFLENHDERRAPEALGSRDRAAATVAYGLPGVRFFQSGQAEGWTRQVPVQLRRAPDEPVDEARREFYEGLFRFLQDDVVHRGAWSPLLANAEDAVLPGVFASLWTLGEQRRLFAANLGAGPVRASLRLPSEPAPPCRFVDAASGEHFEPTLMGSSEVALEIPLPSIGHRLLSSSG